MSMSAVFVQVEAEEAARIEADPSLAEALFDNPAKGSATVAAPESTAAIQERVLAHGPQAVAQILSRLDPAMRERFEKRIGATAASLASGQGEEQLMRLMQERQAEASAMASTRKKGNQKRFSLEKEWHGVHYLLCGETEPGETVPSHAVMGGLELGEDEGFSGYGPARLVAADEVKKISKALEAPNLDAEASGRFDAGRMNKLKIYPGFRPSDLDALMEAIRGLRSFYAEAAEHGRAIVTCIL
jgi:hypothetical protein